MCGRIVWSDNNNCDSNNKIKNKWICLRYKSGITSHDITRSVSCFFRVSSYTRVCFLR